MRTTPARAVVISLYIDGVTVMRIDSFADAAALVDVPGSFDIDGPLHRCALVLAPTQINDEQRDSVSALVSDFAASGLISGFQAESHHALIERETTTAGPLRLLELFDRIAHASAIEHLVRVDRTAAVLGFGPDWRNVPRPSAAYRVVQCILAACVLRDVRARGRNAARLIAVLVAAGARHLVATLRRIYMSLASGLTAVDAAMHQQALGTERRSSGFAGDHCTVSQCPVVPTAPPARASLAFTRGWPSMRALGEAP